jgi:hypothetical protein
MSAVVTVNGDDFSAATTQSGNTFNAWLKGNADYAALDALEMLLTRLHSEADRLSIDEVTVDLRDLEFMNSSCFKSFVTWITEIQRMETDRQYKVTFLSNPKLHWQRRSLQSLRCFAVELITVTEP